MLLRIFLILAILAGIGVIAVSELKVKPQIKGIIDERESNLKHWKEEETNRKKKEKELAVFQDKVAAVIAEVFAWEKLKPAYVKLYAEEFSDEELDGIIAFYKSPSGQAMVSKTPSLMTKATTVVQARMAEAQPQLQKLMREFSEQSKPAQ